MLRAARIAGACVLALGVVLSGVITLTIGWRPFLGPRTRPLTDRKFERTPQRLARGKYLTEGLLGCFHCHSPRNWKQPDCPVLRGRDGAGQDMSSIAGLPGRVVAPNLTPDPATGTGNWSDDELARAIREGIGHDGRTLFPLMPYPNFRQLPDEDIAAVVVYLRSLAPVHNRLPPSQIIFPVKYLIRSVPEPITAPVPEPDLSTAAKRGKFLATVAACADCHTPTEKGQPVAGLSFAGGQVLDGPWGYVASANLTPDPSGIPYYDEARFIKVMRTGHVGARVLNPLMPWVVYRNLTDEDLKALFAWVRTLPPVRHRVDNSEPATYCKICRQNHGAGALN
jgi:mono/diheme cytochrome c family protein